jgi:hypothetical protein
MLHLWRVALAPGEMAIAEAARQALDHAGCGGAQRLVSIAPLERAFVARLSDAEAGAIAGLPWVRSVALLAG